MKKKLAIIGTIALLGVGGFTVFNLNNPDWRANTIFATEKDKQLAWLKEHEEEIVAWIHSKYPKVETVRFEWDTFEVLPVSNGVQIIRYNLSVKGTFNNIPETVIVIDFRMKTKDDIPSMKHITMNNKPSILREGTLYYYE